MKVPSTVGVAALLLLSAVSFPLSVFPQGPLNPTGAPAPSMKSLDQIEARTPISSLPFTISSSGSYYLTKDLSVSTGNGLTIGADKVTVDLNGFTISSTAASATGDWHSAEWDPDKYYDSKRPHHRRRDSERRELHRWRIC